MHVPQEHTDAVRAKIAANPSAMTGQLAKELGISEAEVTAALPEDMRARAKIEDFEAIWQAFGDWEKGTFILTGPGGIAEYSGKIPKGSFGHGMFNLMDKSCALGGHLFASDLGSVWFVSKPFFGLDSLSVQFFNKEGKQMFAVYAGRDDKRALLPAVKASFEAMRAKFAGKSGCGGQSGACCGCATHHPKGAK